MKRQTINIGKFEYIVEMYDAQTDYSPVVNNEYVILRNVSFDGTIAIDTDILFIEKSIYNDIVNSVNNENNDDEKLFVFPCHNTNFGSFSKSIQDYSNLINKDTLKLDIEGGNVFSLYKFNNGNYTNENVFIECDMIKIYHPHNKTDLDYIIYLDNTINGIHFHYFCDLRKNCNYNAEKQFTINNIIYSEYIEIYVPNINSLFKYTPIVYDNGKILEDNNIYINDYYNTVKYLDIDKTTYENYVKRKTKNSSWISLDKKNINNIIPDESFQRFSYVPLWLMLNPFIILENDYNIEEKVYFKLTSQDVNNYNSLPINITLYPYNLPEINNIYLFNGDYPANSDVFTKDFSFKLRSYVGFASDKENSKNSQLCIISKFDFHNKYDEKTNPTGINVKEAYRIYNGLQYGYEVDADGNMTNKIDKNIYYEYQLWKNYREQFIISTEDGKKIDTYNYDEDDEFESDSETYIQLCGYQIDIATDFQFKNIIATNYIESNIISDFEFPLLHLFDDWRDLPNIVIVRVKFIDKYLGVIIKSSNIILNKEWIKYTINDTNTTRLYIDFTKKQNELNNMSWNTMDANTTTFNFIDKLNCIVDKRSETGNIKNYASNNVKIIYKPIFYKAQELQNITFVSGMKQKIGINLSEFMTKVSIFKLVIGDIEIAEFGRNDIYTIFEVDVNLINGVSGTYNIVDSGDVYISSGTWYKK